MTHSMRRYDFRDKAGDYERLAQELASLLSGEHNLVANAANTSSLLYHSLPDINWVGFYFLRDQELIVGPFQGKPACVRIPLGKGVCGTAAAKRETIIVPDVREFPGHIACDEVSLSEIVVPLIKGEAMLGVLDVDSPRLARFDDADRTGLERLAAVFVDSLR
jgi:L-methionine (R)-S-oxide reductase